MKPPKLRNGARTTLALQILRAANCDEGYIPINHKNAVNLYGQREGNTLYKLVEMGWMTKAELQARNGKITYTKHCYGDPRSDGAITWQRKEVRYHLTDAGRAVLHVATHHPETLQATITLLCK